MKKGIILLLLAFILSSILTYATYFEVSHETLTESITPGSEAKYNLTIKNNQGSKDTFFIYSNEFARAPFSDIIEYIFIKPSKIEIDANSEGTVEITIRLFKHVQPNINYKTYIEVESKNTGEKTKEDLIVKVEFPEEIIKIETNLPDEFIASEGLSFQVNLTNTVNTLFKDVDVFIISELFERKFKTPLPYDLPITKDIKLGLSPATQPGRYSFEVKIYQDKDLKASYKKEFNIIRNPNVDEKTELEKKFLVRTKRLIKINKGNLVLNESFLVKMDSFQRLFSKFLPEPDIKNKDLLEWRFELKPNETFDVEIITDYRAFFIFILIVILVIIIIVYISGQKVVIRKEIFKIKEGKEGISEFKILLHIKNKTPVPLKDIVIMDLLPNLISPTEEFGTIKPKKIEKGKRGTRLTWELYHLARGEERIISYKVEPKLSIVGELILPPAITRYKRMGRLIENKSGSIIFTPATKKEG